MASRLPPAIDNSGRPGPGRRARRVSHEFATQSLNTDDNGLPV
jgi:hypothetical protein